MAKESLQDEFLPIPDLRKQLDYAFNKPVACAVGLSIDKKEAVLLLDRKRTGKKLAKRIKADGAGQINLQSIRFGYAVVESGDQNTVQLRTNKGLIGGTIPAALKVVRKAGYGGVVNVIDDKIEDEAEDVDEMAAGENEAGTAPTAPEPTADAVAARPQTPPPPPQSPTPEPAAAVNAAPQRAETPSAPEPQSVAESPPTPPPPPSEPPVDLAKAAARLAALAKMAGPAALAYPSRKAMLVELTSQAKAMLLAGEDPDEKLDAMEAALREIAKARAEGRPPSGNTADQGQGAAADEAIKASLARADQVWRGASGQMRKDLDALKTAVLDAYADSQATQSAIRGSLRQFDGMFSWLDGRLESKIGEALKAATAEERRGLARQSAQIAADYLAAAKSQTKIKDLDENPFAVRTRFGDTIDKVLPNLERMMQGAA